MYCFALHYCIFALFNCSAQFKLYWKLVCYGSRHYFERDYSHQIVVQFPPPQFLVMAFSFNVERRVEKP